MCSGTDPGCAKMEPLNKKTAARLAEDDLEEFRRWKANEKPDEYAPRKPTDAEIAEIKAAFMEDTGTDAEESRCVEAAYIAVFDNYMTSGPQVYRPHPDGPCYCGKLAAVVYGGAPEFCESFIWDKGKCKRLIDEER